MLVRPTRRSFARVETVEEEDCHRVQLLVPPLGGLLGAVQGVANGEAEAHPHPERVDDLARSSP